MSSRFKKETLFIVVLTLGTAAFAKPAHLLYNTGKLMAYPVQHPRKTAHGLWKLVTEVF
jgi:hypothetical protein